MITAKGPINSYHKFPYSTIPGDQLRIPAGLPCQDVLMHNVRMINRVINIYQL